MKKLKKLRRFNIPKYSLIQLLIMAVGFAVVGTTIALIARADTSYSVQFSTEAEAMSVATKGKIIVKDISGASGGKVMAMYSNGTITTPQFITTDKTIKIETTARATYCDGRPIITVKVDGVTQGQQYKVDSKTFKKFTQTVSVEPGTHTLSIAFNNDKYAESGCDRNVFVDKISLFAAVPIPGDTTLPVVSITTPQQDATLTGITQFTAQASDNIGISKVEFYVNGQLQATKLTSPYTADIDTKKFTNGEHTFSVNALDPTGNASTASMVAKISNTTTGTDGTGGGGTTTQPPVSGYWKPQLGSRFMWLIGRSPNVNVAKDIGDGWTTYTGAAAPNADIVGIDGFDNTKAAVDALHSKGKKVVCYISAGTGENWRSDFGSFPASVKGNQMSEWPGEYWLKIDATSRSIVLPIMKTRMQQQCKDKGFDAVEFDNVDGFSQSLSEIGVTITESDQFEYNKQLADIAHNLGLAAALKNDVDQVAKLQPYFDFAINEQCNQYSECGVYSAFINAKKPVFIVEYSKTASTFCPGNNTVGFDSYQMNLALDGTKRITCR